MVRKALIFPTILAAVYVAARAYFRIAGPEAAYYATTAFLLLAIIVSVVLSFVLASHRAVSLFGFVFRRALRRSYILFLGWNLLRSHRRVVVFSVRVGDALHRFLPPSRRLLRTSLLSFPVSAALITGGLLWLRFADPARAISAAFVELSAFMLMIGGSVAAIRGLLGLLVHFSVLRRIDVSDKSFALPMRTRSGVTVPNFISMVGVGIGVWALIMVLSVMSGFEADLRDKILATNAHIIVQAKHDEGPIADYLERTDRIAALEGVASATPFAEGEVMISSPFNTSVNLTVRGVTPEGMGSLRGEITGGSTEYLTRPDLLLSDGGFELIHRKPRRQKAPSKSGGTIEMPPIPGGAPPEASATEEATGGITLPPMPGGAPPATESEGIASALPGILVSQEMAADLHVALFDVVLAIRRYGDEGESKSRPLVEAFQILGVYRRARNDPDRPDAYVLPSALLRLRKDGQRALVTLTADGDKERPGFIGPFDPALPDVAALSGSMITGSLTDLTTRGVPEPNAAGLETVASPEALFGGSNAARVYPGILLGKELAASLRVEVGNEVRLISPDGDVGPTGVRPKASTFVVAGTFATGMYEFDLKLAYVQLADAQRFFNMGDEVNRIEVRVTDPAHTDEVVQRIESAVGSELEALDWKVLNRNLFSALKLEKIAMFFILGFIILVASFNILSSLAMLIQEKTQEIAILKSMGATNGGVMRAFLVLGMFLGLIGAFCGVAMGLGFCLFLDQVGIPLPKEYYIEFIPVDVNWLEVAAAAAAALGISLLATIYPSRTASRLHPVEGLRYE